MNDFLRMADASRPGSLASVAAPRDGAAARLAIDDNRGKRMNGHHTKRRLAAAWLLALAPCLGQAFSSGSTGADGAFNPAVNKPLQLPPSGIFNFTSVNIPAGVTVKVLRNAANTPVVILATSDVTIAGTLDVNGQDAPGIGAAGTGDVGDDGQPGKGGVGGFDGGKGGAPNIIGFGGAGLGPGGGDPGVLLSMTYCYNYYPAATGGAGGGFGGPGGGVGETPYDCPQGTPPWRYQPGRSLAYGSSLLLPLIGGSGGGGGGGGVTFAGGGGGGGGGAILIASSAAVNISGALIVNGGAGASVAGGGTGGTGGGGSGGAIRIMASTITGNGTISAAGGAAGGGQTAYFPSQSNSNAGPGAAGRIRLEADTITRTAATTPLASVDVPGPIFLANRPTLAISSVAGVAAPPNPTGSADITLPANTANPVTVVFTTTNVPVGNTVKLTLTPQFGTTTEVISPALSGSNASAMAGVQVTLPAGPSVLMAQTTYTIVASLGDALRNFAGNERVERITLSASPGRASSMSLITASGKTYAANAEAIRIASAGQ